MMFKSWIIIALFLVASAAIALAQDYDLDPTAFDTISLDRLKSLEQSVKQRDTRPATPAAETETHLEKRAVTSCIYCPQGTLQAWQNNPQNLDVNQELCGIQSTAYWLSLTGTLNPLTNVFLMIGDTTTLTNLGNLPGRSAFRVSQMLYPANGVIGNGWTLRNGSVIIVQTPVFISTSAVGDCAPLTADWGNTTQTRYFLSAGWSFGQATSVVVNNVTYPYLATDRCHYNKPIPTNQALTSNPGFLLWNTLWRGRTVAQNAATCRNNYTCGRWSNTVQCVKSSQGDINFCTGSMFSRARTVVNAALGINQTYVSSNTVSASTINLGNILGVTTCYPRVLVLGDPWISNNINNDDIIWLKNFAYLGGTLLANINRAGAGALTVLQAFTGTAATLSGTSTSCCNCTSPTAMTFNNGTTSWTYRNYCYSGFSCSAWVPSLTSVRATDSASFGTDNSATWCEVTWGAGRVIFFTHWHAFMNAASYAGSRTGLIDSGNNNNILASVFSYPTLLN